MHVPIHHIFVNWPPQYLFYSYSTVLCIHDGYMNHTYNYVQLLFLICDVMTTYAWEINSRNKCVGGTPDAVEEFGL